MRRMALAVVALVAAGGANAQVGGSAQSGTAVQGGAGGQGGAPASTPTTPPGSQQGGASQQVVVNPPNGQPPPPQAPPSSTTVVNPPPPNAPPSTTVVNPPYGQYAPDAVVVRRSEREPMATVAIDAAWGGLAGLVVGGGVALIQQGNNWGRDLMIGAGAGILVGAAVGAVQAYGDRQDERRARVAFDGEQRTAKDPVLTGHTVLGFAGRF